MNEITKQKIVSTASRLIAKYPDGYLSEPELIRWERRTIDDHGSSCETPLILPTGYYLYHIFISLNDDDPHGQKSTKDHLLSLLRVSSSTLPSLLFSCPGRPSRSPHKDRRPYIQSARQVSVHTPNFFSAAISSRRARRPALRTTAAISAPVYWSVRSISSSMLISSARGAFFRCTWKIFLRDSCVRHRCQNQLVKASRPQERRIDDIRPVGGPDYHHSSQLFQAVHLA